MEKSLSQLQHEASQLKESIHEALAIFQEKNPGLMFSVNVETSYVQAGHKDGINYIPMPGKVSVNTDL